MRRPLSLLLAALVTLTAALSTTAALPARSAGELPPPQVIDTSPTSGQEIPVDSAINIFFDQPMDQASVQGALNFAPAIQGALTWQNPKTAVFTPNTPMPRNTPLTVTVTTAAKSATGVPLRDYYTARFRTLGELKVQQIIPADNSANVSGIPLITVIFNRPVIALGTADQMAALPSPITINPPVQGQGQWMGTSIYTFKPTGLQGGARYTVTVNKGLTDITGAQLANSTSTSFTVALPEAIKIDLVRKPGEYYDPNAPVNKVVREAKLTVTFSQPMDTAATEGAFSLIGDDGQPATGKFEWFEDNTRLVFTPDPLLNYQTIYNVKVGPNARSSGGAALTGNPAFKFTTIPLPNISNTYPRNGETGEIYGGFNVQFTVPMNLVDFDKRITVNPPIESADPSYTSPDGTYYQTGWNHTPGTTYTVTIDVNGLVDKYGTPFKLSPPAGYYTFTPDGKVQITYTAANLQPLVELQTNGNPAQYSAYRPHTELFASHVNASRIDLSLYSLSIGEFLNLTTANSYDARRTFNPQGFLRRWSQELQNPPNATRYDLITLAAQGQSAAALPPAASFTCPGAPATRLAVGMTALITPDDPTPLRIRASAGLTGQQVTQLKPGNTLNIIGGPVCLDGYVWWNVTSTDGSVTGWAAEGTPNSYFMGPSGGAAPQQSGGPVVANDPNAPALPKGVYWLDYSYPEQSQSQQYNGQRLSHIFAVSTANVTVKMSVDGAMAWVTDLQSGLPLANVPVSFYTGQQQVSPVGGPVMTDANGLAQVTIPNVETAYQDTFAVVQTDTAFGIGASQWATGIEGWQFGQSERFDPERQSVYIYSDRSMYQPGQPIYFKGVIRDKNDVTYTVPSIKTISVQVVDSRSNQIYLKDLPVNAFGSFSDKVTIPADAAFGSFSIVARPGFTGGEVGNYQGPAYSRYVDIAQYRLPEYEVKLAPDNVDWAAGDTVRVTVDSRYFFGGAVRNSDVSWVVYNGGYPFNYTGSGRYSFLDRNDDIDFRYYGEGQQFGQPFDSALQGTGRTDDQGKFVIEFPAKLDQNGNGSSYQIQATVADPAQLNISGNVSINVHQGEFYIGAGADQFVGTVNQPAQINLIAVDWTSQPIPNVDLSVKVVERAWSSKQVIDEFGKLNYESNFVENTVSEGTAKTGEDGKTTYSFTPSKGGVYKVYATGTDSKGRQIKTSTYLYVAGAGYSPWQTKGERVDLKIDRDSYKIGDTATLLIPSPFTGEATALVTLERGKVVKTEVIKLSSTSTVYQIPITPDLAPNVYVSVMIVKGSGDPALAADYRMGLTSFDVDNERLKLNVAVTTDKPQAGPGETITYKLKVTDYAGNPVQAEVGLGLTDLASLSVAPDTNEKIDEHFYSPQPLGIRTGTLMTANADKVTDDIKSRLAELNSLGPKKTQSGGGGGGGGGGGPESVRQKFIDTPLWEPYGTTDANGELTVTVTLPDNLTQWRLDARAVTQPTGELATTLVGENRFDLTSSKPLLVRPVTPRFFVAGDVATLAAVVNNNTGAAQDVRVRLDSAGINLKSDAEQTVKVANGGTARVEWQIEVQDTTYVDATFSITTPDGKFSDAAKSQAAQGEKLLLPVVRYEAPDTTSTGGSIGKDGGTRVEGVAIPPRLANVPGNLDIRIDPSLAASTVNAIDVLKNQPLASTEGTVSRFLPNLMTFRALSSFGVNDPVKSQRVQDEINYAIQKLESEQHADGGWGWFVTDDSSPIVSAYVLLGLAEAGKAGFTVTPDTLNRAATYVTQKAQSFGGTPTNGQLNTIAFMNYALTKAGRQQPAITARLLTVRNNLALFARAYLAMSQHALNPNDQNVINLAVNDFTATAITSSTGVHWQEQTPDSFNWNTNTRSTAIILQALIELQPTNPLIPDIVRWLMVARKADVWENSQETAWAVMALTSWMQVTGELKPNYTFNLALNDKSLVSNQIVSPESATNQQQIKVAVTDLLTDQTNALVFDRTAGDGMMYYTASLTAYIPVEQIKAVSRGISISRTYSLVSDPLATPITQAKVGEAVRVSVTIVTTEDLNFVTINDPIPAGTDPINPDITTSGGIGQEPELKLDDPLAKGWGYWWFSNTELRFDRTVLYASYLPAGTYQFTYSIQPTLVGTYKVIPATGGETYFPDVYGRSDAALFTVLPK